MYLSDMLEVLDDSYDNYKNNLHPDWLTLDSIADGICTPYVMDAVRLCIKGIYYIFNNLFKLSGAPPAKTFWYEHTQDVGQGAPELNMAAILKAMENAEPHQPILFVGLLEAYYASVWNASFDEQFFAELVKKWSIWE